MKKNDEENLLLVRSADQVDHINSEFYSRFPYPWQPETFHYLDNPHLPIKLLNQNIGDWRCKTIPSKPAIWVAGCGTNQAIYTALRFPDATVIGSDLSAKSLDICARAAKEMRLTNLELCQQSINEVSYVDCFDYIICTGVIHHNSDPAGVLQNLARAMRRSGVMELMMYNRYHRIITSAIQKAVRLLLPGDKPVLQCEVELQTIQRLIRSFVVKNRVSDALHDCRQRPESELADILLQPVEYSYTVESLNELASLCGLELLSPTINEHDQARETYHWHIDFNAPELQVIYEALPDMRRWQVTNLLLLEISPMLWFHLQRADSGRPRRSEAEINSDFLDTIFVRASATQRYYLLQPSGSYELAPKALSFPARMPEDSVAALYGAVDGSRRRRDIFAAVCRSTSFSSVLDARTKLATSAFPFIIAIN